MAAMKTLQDELRIPVGYSDHTCVIEVPIAAVAMGAEIIEKHFTLDKNMDGPDHKASSEPDELKAMVSAIRHIELAIGDGEKRVSPSERDCIVVARKSIVAARNIKIGEVFTANNITVKRPAGGISPMCWHEVIGKISKRNYAEDDFIEI